MSRFGGRLACPLFSSQTARRAGRGRRRALVCRCRCRCRRRPATLPNLPLPSARSAALIGRRAIKTAALMWRQACAWLQLRARMGPCLFCLLGEPGTPVHPRPVVSSHASSLVFRTTPILAPAVPAPPTMVLLSCLSHNTVFHPTRLQQASMGAKAKGVSDHCKARCANPEGGQTR